ncbi:MULTISPECIES: YeeE/YedE family protein [Pacificibacter]|uniref:YeeE/YedE family protein n=1 Tax=Pacificibacter TaxID=1042323 RepID=UPI001C0A4303|nr:MULTISPECIES: YeeE/YedE family protein [Pacificibacter]MBU2935764.1 YeeE/YedE family protein [Pacificibacter marinus]MDO6614260.1 YeeE/YedE family protein [Pacificibacter sp. 1_MG-2023]
MYEQLGLDVDPRQAAIIFGLLIGFLFGGLAEASRFCFRRMVAGPRGERRAASGVWFAGLAVAVIGTQIAIAQGLISFDDHRFFAADLPWLAIVVGGLAFGAGMVLTRGCVSRLTVLAGTGNLRAVIVLLAFAFVAHATLKGVLAPVRTTLGAVTLPLDNASLSGNPMIWSAIIVIAALAIALRSGARKRDMVLGALIGALVPLAWVGTGYVLFDEFDPIAMESLSFTSPAAETLFWGIASSSIPAGFGVGLLGGVVAGALVVSVLFGRFQWQSFETPRQTGRYFAGAALMGVGGVLAGGCTMGAGLSGIPTLSIAAILAVISIAIGGKLTAQLLRDGVPSNGATQTTHSQAPAA